MVENPELDHISVDAMQEDGNAPLTPARWGDIFLYLFGSFGAYFLTSLGLAMIIPEMNLAVTVLTALLNFLCFTGGVYIFGVRRHKISWVGIGLIPPKHFWVSFFGGSVLAVVLTIFRILIMVALVFLTGANLDSLTGREAFFMAGLDSWFGVLLNLFGIGVLVPIAEELLFRGLVYDWFRQKTPVWAAVLISSILFGLGHYDSWLVMVSTFIMGIALALAYEFSNTIWLPISMHLFTNAGGVLLMAAASSWDGLIPGMVVFFQNLYQTLPF